jgi:hypothetical protein
MKVIRALAAGILASSALFAGGLTVVATVSATGPAVTAAAANTAPPPCPSTTHYEYGQCVP